MQATSPQEAPIQLVRNTAPAAASGAGTQRWQVAQIEALFALPFPELLFRAQTVHRANFDPTEVQLSTLLSIKTGAAPRTALTARSRPPTTPASRRPR